MTRFFDIFCIRWILSDDDLRSKRRKLPHATDPSHFCRRRRRRSMIYYAFANIKHE